MIGKQADENIGIVDILRKIWMLVMKNFAPLCGEYQIDAVITLVTRMEKGLGSNLV